MTDRHRSCNLIDGSLPANMLLGSLTMSSVVHISTEIDPAKEVTRTLFDGLFRANVERTGDGKTEKLCVVAQDAANALVGGIYGEIYWSWLNVLVF